MVVDGQVANQQGPKVGISPGIPTCLPRANSPPSGPRHGLGGPGILTPSLHPLLEMETWHLQALG